MPVVITDHTNRVWAVEQPNDGLLHVGFTGQPGPRLLDILEFVETRSKQFEQFVEKRRIEELKNVKKRRNAVRDSSERQLQFETGREPGSPS